MNSYLISLKKELTYYRNLGEKAMAQLSSPQLRERKNESNSIATIVRHLAGNMQSRFTDFLTSDGEKPWRDRDAEFDETKEDKENIQEIWTEGWKCLFDALDALRTQDMDKTVYIRNEGHLVIEALNRQLAHYAYHVGQIVYIAKMVAAEKWNPLSIPKGASEAYNQEKFSREKQMKHFTDE